MENKKIKMLVIPSDTKGGVGYYRSLTPHTYIQQHYGDEFDIDIVPSLPKFSELENFLKQYDLVHFHKQIDPECKVIDMLNFLGIPTIADIDDHYKLGNDHPMSMTAKIEKWHEPIVNHLKKANYISTTTGIFSDLLKRHNPNVVVLPNAIDPSVKQFSPVKNTGDGRLRVGIICGSSHLKDLELVRGIASQVNKEKVQFVLCGFDTRGTKALYDRDKNKSVREIKPSESVWNEFEKIFTDNYKTISPEHKDFLMKYMQVDDPFVNEPYRRMWTRDINNYATHYQNVDVLIAPLKENEFNAVKSELKEIECGFTKTAFIGQNFGPYTINLVPMIEKGGVINEEGTALLVDSSKNHKMWAKYINKLADDRVMLKKLQDNLYNFVKDRYSLDTVCKARVEFYKQMAKK